MTTVFTVGINSTNLEAGSTLRASGSFVSSVCANGDSYDASTTSLRAYTNGSAHMNVRDTHYDFSAPSAGSYSVVFGGTDNFGFTASTSIAYTTYAAPTSTVTYVSPPPPPRCGTANGHVFAASEEIWDINAHTFCDLGGVMNAGIDGNGLPWNYPAGVSTVPRADYCDKEVYGYNFSFPRVDQIFIGACVTLASDGYHGSYVLKAVNSSLCNGSSQKLYVPLGGSGNATLRENGYGGQVFILQYAPDWSPGYRDRYLNYTIDRRYVSGQYEDRVNVTDLYPQTGPFSLYDPILKIDDNRGCYRFNTPVKGGSASWTCMYTYDRGDHYWVSAGEVSCSASRAQETSSCGTANNSIVTSMPTSNLCASGNTASDVTDSGGADYTWTCKKADAPTSISCKATKYEATITGVCGSASKTYAYADTAFAGPLCDHGFPNPSTVAFPVPGTGVAWDCNATHCSATHPTCVPNANCGTFNANNECSTPSCITCDGTRQYGKKNCAKVGPWVEVSP